MRKTITGTGGMLLLQTLKDAGVEYLFTNPGSAETGIFAALAEDGDQRLVVGKHEGLVAAMADGYHRLSGKVGVIIAHVMGGSYQLAGQLFNAQVAGSSLLVIAGDWASELQDYRGLAPFPGLSQAESMRPITKEARAAYQVHANPAAITVATARAARSHHPAHGPRVPLHQRGAAQSRRPRGADRGRRPVPDRAPRRGAGSDDRDHRPPPR
jgi:thiamine pyrophosphate-dependent acetolactate synthase large subunit-like protein